MSQSENTFPIIDTHIHLYAASHIRNLAWTEQLPPNHVLNTQNSVGDYLLATTKASNLRGFVFIETDRKSGLEEPQWQHALEEIEFLARIKSGLPRQGEGHESGDSRLVLGIVPWAPILGGEDAVHKYLAKAKIAASSQDVWDSICGFRYLVQDKPRGTMLQENFTKGLKALEDAGIRSFDLGVDARQGGMWQMEETCEMLENFYANTSSGKLNIIINHMCKPNLRLRPVEDQTRKDDFLRWNESIRKLASFPNTFIKLSGLFSELPQQDEHMPTSIKDLILRTRPWISSVLSNFGPSRVMFGSDWPVCNVGGPGKAKSWQHWHDLVTAVLADQMLSDEDKKQIWCDTAIKAYGLKVSTT